ncbi:TetR/AcrR family transcriptional regulator [Acidiferrimicrobium sp. IK]|uniref:TetR/AcrR family transcriptional regulator n=1 Tax=Acidiferrimicrobium sp. IK TaxID=2871700 RepID=UPI0021CB7787|nr:TetR/AcrR family transcriptional regulator [Acidiferrimicrobium sp. IK]MCU4186781.1 TetR/AcrR family transcriptional regulator [Acidiferrimicrobium sp. IK]
MTVDDRRQRERTARRQLIVATARDLAEQEGWDAVTTRRLSTEIEYSQPVIYKHFTSMEDLMDAVALEGFSELAESLGAARRDGPPGDALRRVAHAFMSFAAENPALYDAMFSRTTRLRFGAPDSPAALVAGFEELRQAIVDSTTTTSPEVETLTEVIWSALHGLTTLARGGRLRLGLDRERIELLVGHFVSGRSVVIPGS